MVQIKALVAMWSDDESREHGLSFHAQWSKEVLQHSSIGLSPFAFETNIISEHRQRR